MRACVAGLSLDVRPLSLAIGAEVRGVDLRHVDVVTAAAIRDLWLRRLVLVFPDQRLDADALVRFTATIGPPDIAPPQENTVRSPHGRPEVMIVSNVVEDGVPIGSLGNGEAPWHTDMCYTDVPPSASLLYALEVPARGGDTSFLDMYAAFDALPGSTRRRLATLRTKHDRTYTAVGALRHGEREMNDVRLTPGAIHPILRVHPETGRTALYLGRRRNAWICGLAVAESEALLDEIWDAALRSAGSIRHVWRPGDLVLWDNRCTMHRRDSFASSERRVMLRTQVRGARPVGSVS
jgi:taurine dioxygenase